MDYMDYIPPIAVLQPGDLLLIPSLSSSPTALVLSRYRVDHGERWYCLLFADGEVDAVAGDWIERYDRVAPTEEPTQC